MPGSPRGAAVPCTACWGFTLTILKFGNTDCAPHAASQRLYAAAAALRARACASLAAELARCMLSVPSGPSLQPHHRERDSPTQCMRARFGAAIDISLDSRPSAAPCALRACAGRTWRSADVLTGGSARLAAPRARRADARAGRLHSELRQTSRLDNVRETSVRGLGRSSTRDGRNLRRTTGRTTLGRVVCRTTSRSHTFSVRDQHARASGRVCLDRRRCRRTGLLDWQILPRRARMMHDSAQRPAPWAPSGAPPPAQALSAAVVTIRHERRCGRLFASLRPSSPRACSTGPCDHRCGLALIRPRLVNYMWYCSEETYCAACYRYDACCAT